MKNPTQRYWNFHLLDNKGSTLVELLVAMGLLLAVILPAGAFLGYMANFPKNKEKIIAMGEAQAALEQMISQQEYKERSDMIPIQAEWKLKEQVSIEGKKAILETAVYRRDEIIVELSTVRLVKSGDDND